VTADQACAGTKSANAAAKPTAHAINRLTVIVNSTADVIWLMRRSKPPSISLPPHLLAWR
jgi:hypothetical protein